MSRQQEPPKSALDLKTTSQLGLAIATTHAMGPYLFLRFGMGVDQPGIWGILALLGMCLYAEAYRSLMMWGFIKAWFVMLIIQRLFRDRRQHSLYLGYPWFAAMLPPARWCRNRERVAQWMEPIICMVVGSLLMKKDEMFGRFIFAGAFSLTAMQIIQQMMQARLRIEMNNAYVEAERYR